MPIIIKREDTVRLARTLKQKTGLPMTRIIHAALEEHMRHMGNAVAARDRQLAEMRAISRRVAQLPDRDTRSANDIVGYDENGLPS